MDIDIEKLAIVHYPHPALRKRCETIEKFDEQLAAIAKRMLEIMYAGKGVGLAAPQVGLALRLIVLNPTGEEHDGRIYVNPAIRDMQGNVEAEEGCLSLPGINVNVRRAQRCRIVAQDLQGNPIEHEGSDLLCRIWQHETDHLNGVMIVDRMGPTDRIATRKTLRALEDQFGSKAAG